MEINYFNLSGGINQSLTKTELGSDTRSLFWTDSKNIEVYDNRGLVKQKGNVLLTQLPVEEKIICMCELESDDVYKLFIVTQNGKIYVYASNSNQLTLVNKTLTGQKVSMTPFLRGVIVKTESDSLFYIKDNENLEIEDCNLVDDNNQYIYPDGICVYKGRVWCYKNSTIYYSALGTYDNFSLEDDAGYINDFYTDTSDITGMKNYKDYLAIYKKERVYLLSGSNPSDFAVIPFADKGTFSNNSIVNVDNKQYFLSNGIYALEQVGELNQIRLGSEISRNISNEFDLINKTRISETIAINYKNKHQIWFFFPYVNDDYYHTIWINDYVNHAWFKRVVPQNLTYAVMFNSNVITADNKGRIYREDYGSSFNGTVIDFMWKSPFLSFNKPHHRKIIDEFYFVLDDNADNKFNFSVYKDYDGNYYGDKELIFSRHYNQLLWAKENQIDESVSYWPGDEADGLVWSIGTDTIEKAEICDSCYSVMLCVEGTEADDNCAIIGLQFREIYNDD